MSNQSKDILLAWISVLPPRQAQITPLQVSYNKGFNFNIDALNVTELQYGLKGLSNLRPVKLENLLEVVRDCLIKGKYRDTIHASQRQKERKIILPEIIHVLNTGRHEKGKDRFEEAFHAWNYAIRGWTLDEEDLRVIVSFEEENDLLIITAFYLEKRRKTL